MSHPFPDKCKVIQNCGHAEVLAQNLQTFYKDNELADVTLIATQEPNNFKMEAHRVILSLSSNFFLAMFRNPMKEAQTEEVELNVDGTTLKLLLDFIYTGSIELRNDTVENVLEAAGLYSLENLKTICCNFMEEQLDVENCLGVVRFAELHGYGQLLTISFAFACNHFEEVSTGREYLELSHQQVLELISSSDIHQDSKDTTIKSLIAWVEHDKENREKYLLGLLSQVSSMNYIKQPLMPLNPVKMLGFAYCVDQRVTNGFPVQLYNPESNEWSYKIWPSPLRSRSQYSVTVIKNHLYIVGGLTDDMPTSTAECLNLKTLKWSDMPTMKSSRYWPTTTHIGDLLYVMGPHSINNTNWWIERFHTNNDMKWSEWHLRTDYNTGVAQMVALNGILYIAIWNSRYINYFDPHRKTWGQFQNDNNNLINFGVAVLDGCLYLVGGEKDGSLCKSETVTRYDPSKESWVTVAPLSLKRSHVVCTTLNNCLIVYGGLGSDGKESETVEKYNPETNKWTQLSSLLPHKYKKIPFPLFNFEI